MRMGPNLGAKNHVDKGKKSLKYGIQNSPFNRTKKVTFNRAIKRYSIKRHFWRPYLSDSGKNSYIGFRPQNPKSLKICPVPKSRKNEKADRQYSHTTFSKLQLW